MTRGPTPGLLRGAASPGRGPVLGLRATDEVSPGLSFTVRNVEVRDNSVRDEVPSVS